MQVNSQQLMKDVKLLYTMLLVDADDGAREGLVRILDWERLGLSEPVLATDGEEAYWAIVSRPPDLLILGMNLSGISGLELIRRTNAEYPAVKMVVLAGYDEFGQASEAQRYGVTHFLLKPFNKQAAEGVIRGIVLELREQEEKRAYIRDLQGRLERELPQMKEQFLRDLLLHCSYSREELEFGLRLIEPECRNVRLVLIQPCGEIDALHIRSLKEMAEEGLRPSGLQLVTTVGRRLVALISDGTDDEALARLYRLKERFHRIHRAELNISITEAGPVEDVARLYTEARDCLDYNLDLPDGGIITTNDSRLDGRSVGDGFGSRFVKITSAVKMGNLEVTHSEVTAFFGDLAAGGLDTDSAMAYCLELLIAMARQAPSGKISSYINEVVSVLSIRQLEDVHRYAHAFASEITSINCKTRLRKRSELVERIVSSVQEHLSNEELTLAWLAKEKLFMSVDYVGKLFKRETREKFTQFLLRERLERAAGVIRSSKDCKMYEVAEQTGFGSNIPYFSQVFKKHFDLTPTEYRKLYFSAGETCEGRLPTPGEEGALLGQLPAARRTKPAAEPIPLRMSFWASSRVPVLLTKRVIELFEYSHPDIRIEPEFTSWDAYFAKLIVQAEEDRLPDIVRHDYRFLAQHVRRGVLRPLDDLVEAGVIDLSAAGRSYASGGIVDGRLYGMNLGINTLSVFYDPAAFDKAGVEAPGPEWTWEQYEQDSLQLGRKLGFCDDGSLMLGGFEIYLRQHGQSLFHKEGGSVGFEREVMADYLRMQLRLSKAGVLLPYRKAAGTNKIEHSAFVKGEQPMTVQWSNMIFAYEALSRKRLEIGLPPGAGKGQSLFLKPSQFMTIAATSKHPEKAGRFIDFWINNVEANRILNGCFGLPVSSKVLEAAKPNLGDTQQKVAKYMQQAAGYASPIDPPDPDGAEEVRKLLDYASRLVLGGQISAKDGAEQFVRHANRIVETKLEKRGKRNDLFSGGSLYR
ncbi:extracellular solute-binding protein [Paenibacillus ginsengarvi]|uniref:Extracellular solute-binding protein n=1 Tax=Paenibacillus ginsengarvi TaxID=400777 RepID=A0A3B0C3T5_9BACL|nr:extracellular solute-binding protein [Paenibacillus ginsengarvi]RKN79024.1 extracellular solute-binding protein [Paenibacillus ginsengarvi]